MSAEHGEIHGGAWADGGPDSMTFRHHEGRPGRTNAENEAELITVRISIGCFGDHHDAQDAGCTNPSCQCWCH